MNPEPIRVAVLGYGLAGRVFHCPFVNAVPGLELAAIVQRHGNEASQAYPQVHILRSANEAFADPTIDLVIVGTPNETHQELAQAALSAGKHVVVDKPMAPTSQGVRKLMDTARDAGKLLFPFHNRRWDGDFLTLQNVLAQGKLGRVVKAISHWDRFRPGQRAGSWKESANDAHGILQDLGPHLLDQAMALFGSPQRLTASVRSDRDRSDIEDAFDVLLEYDQSNGHLLQFACHASMIAADPAPRFRIHGTEGSFTKCGLDPQEAHL
ncbi:MAG: Gfo/Idh/MocA family oxidoreductase, partial [Janthinobacterium lividum]